MKVKLLTALLLLSVLTSYGQIVNKKLTKTLDQLIAKSYGTIAPGGVVLIGEKGKVAYERAFGKANLELDVTMKPGMIFRIGSITKQFTAVAILKLIEEGKLSLHDSLQKYIPDFPAKGHPITIENLLTHTSGIVDYGVLDFDIRNAIRIDFPQKQFIDSLAPLPLEFTPGSRYQYSNSNYFILGYVIERVTGKPYAVYLKEAIYKPAGLHHTFYDTPSDIISGRVDGYSGDSSRFKNAGYISMNQAFAAGALLSNAEDLFKWHQALWSFQLISKETLKKATSRFRLSDGSPSGYGYGWFIREFAGNNMVGHGGAIDGFRSMEIYFPSQDIFITALFNSDNDEFFSLFENIAALVIQNNQVSSYKDLKLGDTVLDSYVGTYRFPEYTTEQITIYKQSGRLYANLSNRTGMHMPLYAQTSTLFFLPIIKRIPTSIEFVVENGKVTALYWIQEKRSLAKKVVTSH